jgi:hypothetical protein
MLPESTQNRASCVLYQVLTAVSRFLLSTITAVQWRPLRGDGLVPIAPADLLPDVSFAEMSGERACCKIAAAVQGRAVDSNPENKNNHMI